MKLTIGKRFRATVATLEEASRIYCRERDRSGQGASRFPDGRIDDTHYVSYNGRVWAGAPNEWKPDAVPVCEAATATDRKIDEIRIRATHCARVQCVAVHDYDPPQTPCQECVDAATRILCSYVITFGGSASK